MRRVSINAQKVIRMLDRDGYDSALKIRVDPATASEVDSLLRTQIRSIVERESSSLRVLQEIRESSSVFDSTRNLS